MQHDMNSKWVFVNNSRHTENKTGKDVLLLCCLLSEIQTIIKFNFYMDQIILIYIYTRNHFLSFILKIALSD